MIAEPVTRNFTVPQGATYPVRMRYLVNGTPVNITGATVRAQLRTHPSATTATIDCTIANGKAYLDAGTGYFGFDLLPSDTTPIAATTYYYDLELVIGIDVTRALQGTITLTPEVTR